MNDITCFGSRSIFYLTLHESASNSYLFCYNNPIAYVDFLGGVSLQFSWSAPIPPIPFSVIGASIIPDLSFRGQFSECRLCNGTIPEIHSYAEGEVSLSFGLQWGLSRKDGINSRGQYVYESGKYPNGNTRYRDLSGRFAKAPSTDLLGELLGLHLEEQDFIPATMEDWATLPICPDNHWEGSISAYVRGQATVLGVGASMNFVWQILPDGALIPDFEGRRGYVGGGTALYAEIGVTGSLRFTTLW